MSVDWDLAFKATSAIGSILVGAGALAIAYLKWQDDREKIKNDLWQQRFEIYQHALYALNGMKILGIKNWHEDAGFKTALHKAKFAFPDNAPYRMMEEMWEIWWLYPKSSGHDTETSMAIEDELQKRLTAVDLDAAFSKYLKRRF